MNKKNKTDKPKIKNIMVLIIKTFHKIYKRKIDLKNRIIIELLDSIQIYDFISLLERKFKIKFTDNEISAKNFSNIQNIEILINKKKNIKKYKKI